MGAAAIPIAIGLQAGGGLLTANAQNQAGKFNERIANLNAQFKDIEVKDALDRGQVKEGIQRQRTKAFAGRQRAAFGSSGVDVNEGSPLDVLEATVGIGELDALTIRSNAERESFRFKRQAENLRFQGKQARRAGSAQAIGTLLGTAGQFASLAGKSSPKGKK